MEERDVKSVPITQATHSSSSSSNRKSSSSNTVSNTTTASNNCLTDTARMAAYSPARATTQTPKMQLQPQQHDSSSSQQATPSQQQSQIPYYSNGAQHATTSLPPPTILPQQDYRIQTNGAPAVSLPPIQHFKSTQQDDMQAQAQAPPPPSQQQPYAHMNGDPMMHPPPQMQYGYHQNGMMPALMPAANGQMLYPRDTFQDRRYTPPSLHPLPSYGMIVADPRQMSGGRHKKEIKRRTKTGCLTCRKRRIKCDEGIPSCRNCEKSKRECMGYDPVFRPQTGPAPIQPAPTGSMQSGQQQQQQQQAVKVQYIQQQQYAQADNPVKDGRRMHWTTAPVTTRNYPGMVPVMSVRPMMEPKSVMNGDAQQQYQQSMHSGSTTDPQLQQS